MELYKTLLALHIAGGSVGLISGTINIIDLVNVYSGSFIATDDIGKLNADGSFEVLGRIDGSDLRGCSLMVDSMEIFLQLYITLIISII